MPTPITRGVDPSFHLLENFRGRSLVVKFRVGRIFELGGHEGFGIASGEFFGAGYCSLDALGVRSTCDLGAEGPHEHDFFLRKTVGNEQRHFISAIHPNQREPDAGVSRSCFDDSATGFEQALLFGTPNDADRGAVFHTSTGIQVLQLGVDLSRIRRHQLFQLKERSFADQLSNVVGDAQARALDCLGSHITGYGSAAEASIELSGNRLRLALRANGIPSCTARAAT